MRITESNLRRLVRASLLSEVSMATASDIARFKPQLEEWVDVLIDDMASTFPRMKDASEKQKKNLGSALLRKISVELVSLTSGMSWESKKRIDKRNEDEQHKKWDRERNRRSSNVSYYGDYKS